MALKYGFYDAKYDANTGTYDRTYDAETMSSLFDGIVNDGVFLNYKNAFKVTGVETASNTIQIDTGRCWFDHTWTSNEYPYTIKLSSPPSTSGYTRYDALYLKVDKGERINSIISVTGTQTNGSPTVPVPSSLAVQKTTDDGRTYYMEGDDIYYHLFSIILRSTNNTNIANSSIEMCYDAATLNDETVSLYDLFQKWWNILVKDVTGESINSRYFYAYSYTSSSKKTKVAYCYDDIFTLQQGVVVRVYFENPSGSKPTTLCVNQTAAKNMVYNNADRTKLSSVSGTLWNAGDILTFIYDGTQWILMDDWDVQNTIADMESDISDLKTYINQAIASILAKINGGGKLNSDGSITWGDSVGMIPIGNINVTSNSGGYIRCHENTDQTNDLKAL